MQKGGVLPFRAIASPFRWIISRITIFELNGGISLETCEGKMVENSVTNSHFSDTAIDHFESVCQ